MARTAQFSRMNYNVARGMKELVSRHDLKKAQWQMLLQLFDSRCAFCGRVDTGNTRTGLVADHLVAAANGGGLCLGNAVPACHDCNDHRGKRDWREYLEEQFPDDATPRIEKIEEYLRQYPYVPTPNADSVLSLDESREYASILEDWAILWSRARVLKKQIHARLRAMEKAARRKAAG